MTWSDFYLICFLLGLALSVLSFLSGSMHLHIPHLHLHLGGPHIHAPGAHGVQSEGATWLNFGTLVAFLTWFGGAGYLVEHYYAVWFLAALGISIVAGMAGAAIVFWFLAKLYSPHENLDPADYEMVGVLGKLSIPIREGGTGEIVFSQEGVRHVAGARSDDGIPISKGTEVVVTRYEKGIAYVRRWEDLAAS
jgi:membrane protein implicated in regulation of membrane protease activity